MLSIVKGWLACVFALAFLITGCDEPGETLQGTLDSTEIEPLRGRVQQFKFSNTDEITALGIKGKYLYIGGHTLSRKITRHFTSDQQSPATDHDYYLEKRKLGGASVWRRRSGFRGFERLSAIAPDSKENVYFAGYRHIRDAPTTTAYLGKTNLHGQLEWFHTLPGETLIKTVLLTARETALYAGGIDEGSAMLIKFDITGAKPRLEWKKKIGTWGSSRLWSIAPADDETIVVLGSSNTSLSVFPWFARDDDDLFVARLSKGGGLDWHHSWRNEGNEIPVEVKVNSREEVVVLGYQVPANEEEKNRCLLLTYAMTGVLKTQAKILPDKNFIPTGLNVVNDDLILTGHFYNNSREKMTLDVFLSILGPRAVVETTYAIGTRRTEYAFATAVAGDRIYIGGTTQGSFVSRLHNLDKDMFLMVSALREKM